MTLQRVDDWDLKLYERIAEWEDGREFVDGKTDCTAFCSDCVEAMTGVDFWADWAGQYKDAKSAAKLIRKRGHHSLFHVLQSIFGRSVHVAFAKRGDIVYGKLGLVAPQIGICLGEATKSWRRDGLGMVSVPTLKLKRAFHV